MSFTSSPAKSSFGRRVTGIVALIFAVLLSYSVISVTRTVNKDPEPGPNERLVQITARFVGLANVNWRIGPYDGSGDQVKSPFKVQRIADAPVMISFYISKPSAIVVVLSNGRSVAMTRTPLGGGVQYSGVAR